MSAMSVAVLANDLMEAIINTGSAEPLPGMAVGDIVLANKLSYHDVDGSIIFGYKCGQWQGQHFLDPATVLYEMKKVLEEEAATTHLGA